ncbi:MAG TPA: DUF488 domain-containing protein [Kofleriaceae bacterium]
MAAETRKPSVLTIGHSKHPIDRFLGLLRQHGVESLVDARSHPFSRFSPQFTRKPLEQAVRDAGVRYAFLGNALGGRPAQPECYDEHGKLDYARVERLDVYQRGIDELLDEAARRQTCVLCAEEDPSRCHRRLLITRTLVQRGARVLHIRGSGAIEPETELGAPRQLGLL